MNWDWHPADAAFFSEPPEPVDPNVCCEFKEVAKHRGQKYCVSCAADLDDQGKPLEPPKPVVEDDEPGQMYADEDLFPPGS